MDQRTSNCGIEDEPAREPEFDYELAQAAAEQAQAIKAKMFPERFGPKPKAQYDFAPETRPPEVSDCGI